MNRLLAVWIAAAASLGLPARRAEANQVVLPGSIQVSSSGRASDPAAAFNTVDHTWLVVWREADATLFNVGEIRGRIVLENRTFAGPEFGIEGGAGALPPRVAHDPIRNEWMVVTGDGPVFDAGLFQIRARKVSSTGALVGSQARSLSAGNVGEAFPDVAAATSFRTEVIGPTTPFFMVVWQQDIGGRPGILALRTFDDPADPSRITFSTAPFQLDADATLPAGHKSTRPRITEFAPRATGSGPAGALRSETYHRVVFELEDAGQKDVYLTAFNLTNVRATVRITQTTANETAPVVAYNAQSNRTIVGFERAGSGIRAQLVEPTTTSPFLGPLGTDFAISPGITPSLVAQAAADVFLASAEDGTRLGLGCLAGLRMVGTPSVGTGTGSTQPVLSPSLEGGVLLGFLRTNADGTKVIRASVVDPLAAIPNNPPIARAGADLQVAEGTLFSLDGSTSSDPDGDTLRFQWARTDAGNAGDFFVADAERGKAKPQLQAPMLAADLAPITLTFQVAVDDFRSAPPFGPTDAVNVKVVAGADPHPPVARAGSDQTVDEDRPVQLDGSASSDADGDLLTFHWTLQSIVPPAIPPGNVALSGADTPAPSFVTPRFSSQGGIDLHLKLAVSSPRGGVGEDEVVVHVRDSINEAPIANAGADLTGGQAVSEGSAFQLDGTASKDPNGDAITYKWELVSVLSFNGNLRETLDIVGDTTATPSLTAQVFNERDLEFRLTVKDPSGLTGVDQVIVRVKSLPMQVTNIAPMAGCPGTIVTISGTGFASPDTRVFFGVNDLIHQGQIQSITDSKIVVLVPSGGPSLLRALPIKSKMRSMVAIDYLDVTSGIVTVKKGAEVLQSAQPFEVSHVEIFDAYLNQGMETYPLIQKKDTLLHLRVRAAPGPQAPLPNLTSATCSVFPSGQSTWQVAHSTVPPAALARTASVTALNEAVNFYLEGPNVTASTYRFDARLYNNGIEVAGFRTDDDSATFTPTHAPRILGVKIVPFENGHVSTAFDADRPSMLTRIDNAVKAFRRIYPMPETEFVFWPDEVEMSDMIQSDGKVHLEAFGFSENFLIREVQGFNSLTDTLESWNNLHPDQKAEFVVGFIAKNLYAAGTAQGVAIPPVSMMSDIIKFYAEDNIGAAGDVLKTVLGIVEDLVCAATLGLYCKDPVDIIVDIVLGLLQVATPLDVTGKVCFVVANDSAGATLAQEVGHNLGFVNPFEPGSDSENISHSIYDENHGPSFISVPGVYAPIFNVVWGTGSMFDGLNLPKSVMSYAPLATNQNTFFEPFHYRRLFDAFRADVSALKAPAGNGGGAVEHGPALRVSGLYSFRDGTAEVREARPALPSEGITPASSKSPLTLAFVDAVHHVLAESGILFEIATPIHGHGHDGEDGDTENIIAFFRAVAEIPAGTTQAELRFQGSVLWSRSALGVSPHVELNFPTGGEVVDAGAELDVRWLSLDSDGDELTHTVYFSLDGGATFEPLALAVVGGEHRWSTAATQGSDHAVLKVVSSDGFHTSESISGEFRLGGGKLSASILTPSEGAKLVSTRPFALAASSRMPGGAEVTDDAAFHWSVTQNQTSTSLGAGRTLLAGPLAPGAATIHLDVEAGGQTASAEISIVLLPDRDGDGVDDATEIANGLDPDDPDDLFRDDDGDGIATGPEVLDYKSDPTKADTDGDGIPDGQEVDGFTSPTKKDTDGDGRNDNADNCPTVPNPDQADTDGDGIGDACPRVTDIDEPIFRRGDSNGDGVMNLSDAVGILSFLFTGGAAPVCRDSSDANDDTKVDISDALTILGYLFLGSAAPPAPGPQTCGPDPTADTLERCAYPKEMCR